MKILRHFFRLSIDACLRRWNAFAVGELLFFAGPKKSNQKKGPYRSRAQLVSVWAVADFRTRHPWLDRKWSSDPLSEVSPDRGSALSFGYFSLGAIKEK